MAEPKDKPAVAKRSGGKHFSISEIHRGALNRFVERLREELGPSRKVNASTVLESMIERFCFDDPMLKEYLEMKKKMAKLKGENA